MKKERIFYLDLIRVFAMAIIVSYHFFVCFEHNDLVFTNFFLRKGTGTLGNTLFFAISGAALFYNYKEKLELKSYYKKRFWAIFPLFWLTYFVWFMYQFVKNKGFFINLPIYKLGFTVIGMDGYLNDYTLTWYLLGEWFLSAIIILYLLFPLLKKLMDKHPKILLAICRHNVFDNFISALSIPNSSN